MPKRTASALEPSGAKVKPKKNSKHYKFPEHIPSGYIIIDTQKNEWEIHETIGTGGFGEIYSASKVTSNTKKDRQLYAVKVEPKDNGPLFVEMHFYMRVAKPDEIKKWKSQQKLKHFGMPVLHGSGSFEYKSNSYRFLVIDRFGRNLQDILNENNKKFPLVTVLQIGIQTLNVLEYIHSKGYIHGDIKAANMMLGCNTENENTVYLIDFGIAGKCTSDGKELNKDPKKVNNGTIEYISRDGHTGVFGFRGDLEILGYNLIHWLNGTLPWEKDITKPVVVEQKKNELMDNPAGYSKIHLPNITDELIQYLKYIKSLKNNEVPDYEFCRNLLVKKLNALNVPSPYSKLAFSSNSNGESTELVSLNSSPKGKKKLSKPKVSKKNASLSSAKSVSSEKPKPSSTRKLRSNLQSLKDDD